MTLGKQYKSHKQKKNKGPKFHTIYSKSGSVNLPRIIKWLEDREQIIFP